MIRFHFLCYNQLCAFLPFFGFFEVLDVGYVLSGLGLILYRSAGLRAYGDGG